MVSVRFRYKNYILISVVSRNVNSAKEEKIHVGWTVRSCR